MSVLPVHVPSIGRWSLAPRPRTAAPAVDAVVSPACEQVEADEWVRMPLPTPLFIASTAVGSLAMIMSGVGFLVLR